MDEVHTPGPMIDPSKHSAAFKIFNYRFKCAIQPIHMYSENVLREGGLVTSGFAEIDRASMHKFVPCYLLIAAMAEYVNDGVPFKLYDPNDAVKIYQIIRQHLNDHLRSAQNDINKVKVPLEDLRKLDAVAELVYPISRGMMNAQTLEESDFFRRLREFGGRGLLSKLAKPKSSVEEPPKDDRGYTSTIPGLSAAISRRNKPWVNSK